MALRKRDVAVKGSERPLGEIDPVFRKSCPYLWEFMSGTTYEDGSERKLPSITIFVGPDGLQACLNDRDQGLVAFVTATGLAGLWTALEQGLREDRLDWRRASPPGQRKGRK